MPVVPWILRVCNMETLTFGDSDDKKAIGRKDSKVLLLHKCWFTEGFRRKKRFGKSEVMAGQPTPM